MELMYLWTLKIYFDDEKKLPKTIFLGILHPSSFLNKKERYQTQSSCHPTLSNLRSNIYMRKMNEDINIISQTRVIIFLITNALHKLWISLSLPLFFSCLIVALETTKSFQHYNLLHVLTFFKWLNVNHFANHISSLRT